MGRIYRIISAKRIIIGPSIFISLFLRPPQTEICSCWALTQSASSTPFIVEQIFSIIVCVEIFCLVNLMKCSDVAYEAFHSLACHSFPSNGTIIGL